ncbi:MAG: hypothetical protein ACR2PZ_04190 [Pseudomonadales bacterium]
MANRNSNSPFTRPPEERVDSYGSLPRRSELRFKTLGLVDLLLGDALLVNSRCLRFLALQRGRRAVGAGAVVAAGQRPASATETVLSDQEMLALRRCVTRLGSHWRLLRGTAAGSLAKAALARVKHIERLIPPGSGTGRAAKELLEQTADPKRRAALREVMDQWVSSKRVRQVSAIDRDRLLELLEQDAGAWQEAVDQVDAGESEPILEALKTSYRRPRRLGRRMDQSQANDKHLSRLLTLVAQNVAQLELLRPGLSEQYAKQLWYLQRLERNLRRRLDLSAFEQRLFAMDLRSDRLVKVQQRAQQAVQARAGVQAQRTEKLISLAYGLKPKVFLRGIAKDLSAADGKPLILSDSHLDTLSAAQAAGETNHLGEITVEEPVQR